MCVTELASVITIRATAPIAPRTASTRAGGVSTARARIVRVLAVYAAATANASTHFASATQAGTEQGVIYPTVLAHLTATAMAPVWHQECTPHASASTAGWAGTAPCLVSTAQRSLTSLVSAMTASLVQAVTNCAQATEPAAIRPVLVCQHGGVPFVRRRDARVLGSAAQTTATAPSLTRHARVTGTGQGMTATRQTVLETQTATAEDGVTSLTTSRLAVLAVSNPWELRVNDRASTATRLSPSPISANVTLAILTLDVRQSALPEGPASTPPVSVSPGSRESTASV